MKDAVHTSPAVKAKDRLLIWLPAIRRQVLRLVRSRPAAILASFATGLLLTRAVFFLEYAPLGVAFTAASHKKHVIPASIGAILGYVFSPLPVDGLKYAAAAVLCLSAALVFKGTEAMRYRLFMPLAAAVSIACVGFVFVLEKGFSLPLFSLFLCEICLAAVAAWFYEDALSGDPQKETAEELLSRSFLGYLILGFSLLCAFSDVTLAGVISPVRAAALLFVLGFSRKKGASAGAAAGLLVGALMDMRGGGAPFYCMTYGFSGFIGGLWAAKSKLSFALMFVLANGAASVWGFNVNAGLSGLYECFIASILFMLLPADILVHVPEAGTAAAGRYVNRARAYASKRIGGAAAAFSEIYQTLASCLGGGRQKNDEDISIVFDMAADKVCRGCAIRNACWERDYVSTYTAVNDASSPLLKNGQVERTDFPNYFASRCLHFPNFVNAVNEAAAALAQRRQHKARMRENGEVIREQYAGVAGILRRVAAEVEAAPEFCPQEEQKISSFIREWDKECAVSVFRTPAERLVIELSGRGQSSLADDGDKLAPALSKLAGCTLARPEHVLSADGWTLTFREAERLSATVGVGVRKKQGEQVSGDNGTYFKTEDGLVYLILSDGMGTGREAAAASATAIRLLERFLRAGIPASEALQAAWPALKLKSDEKGFATLDILSLNLFTGDCELLKCGAAGSFVRAGGRMNRVKGGTLPPGVGRNSSTPPEAVRIRLEAGDFTVMLSDGITGVKGEDWLFEIIAKYEGDSPKELARAIIDGALNGGPAEDDMTVLVLHVKNKEQETDSLDALLR